MDKRRIKVRLSDTDTGLILNETSYDLNLWFANNRKVLYECLRLFIDQLRSTDGYFSIEFNTFKDEVREGVLPF